MICFFLPFLYLIELFLSVSPPPNHIPSYRHMFPKHILAQPCLCGSPLSRWLNMESSEFLAIRDHQRLKRFASYPLRILLFVKL